MCFGGLICDNKSQFSFYLLNGGCFISFHYVWFMFKLDIWFVYHLIKQGSIPIEKQIKFKGQQNFLFFI
jgi:hypothetical protein